MIQISNLFRKLDFNSQPFGFFVEKDEKKKKTEVGGILSISAIIISAIYLSYLLYLFFGNQIIPKITTQLQNQTTKLNQNFNKSIFGITYTTSGLTPDQLEQQTGKVFLTYQVQKQTFLQGNYEFIDLNLIDCPNDPNFIGYKCIDFSNQPDTLKELFTDPTNLNQSYYSLVVQPCQGLPNCANPQDIENYIMQATFVFFIKIRVNQFNQQTQQMDETFLIDFFQFDQNISIFHQYFLQQQVSTLSQGYFIQGSDTRVDITNYRKSTAYYSQQNLLQKAGFTGYGQFFFSLDQMQIITKIQFPLITETLSQFLPIFNFLLALGFIAKIFAESRLIQDINNVYLKQYYKQTAIKLISDQNKDLIINKAQLTQAEYIQQLSNAINNANLKKKQKPKQKTSVQTLNNDKKDNCQFESERYQLILDQTKKKLNISELYSDLIEIKTAIKLLMSPDQYAAMKFCGCDISLAGVDLQEKKKKRQQNAEKIDKVYPSLITSLPSKNVIQKEELNLQMLDPYENKLSQKMNSKQKEEGVFSNLKVELTSKKSKCEQDLTDNNISQQSKNHLEQIEEMLANKQIMFQKLQNFIEKVQNKNQLLSQTDINIYSSLIGQNYQDLDSNQYFIDNINS
ncbi:transmembrane protein, putative (macronuclear) [Tetrahymena thermophila SB210]|uniref:Transmembrane protein, putative n=1 Tax=Tetrahymena thermophila (strain SB210) TaxID=312017 RepID=I7MDQ5_TETTS|nr:transmembrane protein, putative [Tetrahymena thermophila SB210]EAR90756.2 transmembrane protein, putative [Tetrahymena thermophila SB210]|eukprot:XP_001011001.2 transmembrane protein, putative [Tetrahymena thermophila SB210]